MPLSLAEVRKPYTIRAVTGKDEVRSHLRNLGIVENETISILQSIAGSLIVSVKGIRIALNQDLARRIQI